MRRRALALAALAAAVAATAAPARAASDINSPYGVVAFIPSPTRFDAMKDANIAWGRYDFSWREVETSKGVFNWAVQDYAVQEANARGLHIYAGLGYTPTWASSNSLHRPQDRPTNNQDFYDYVYAAVSRYKDSIKYWEIWNEPNLTQFWNGTRQQYIDLLKVAADAAHAADPDCFVLAPEISSAGSFPNTPSAWVTDVLNQAGNKVDIIAFHQYDGSDTPSGRLTLINNMVNSINTAGYGNKPIWITESGFRADASGMTEAKQADYLTQMLTGIAAQPAVDKFFWYQIWEGATDTYGLLRQDESRKPAWQAYHDYTVAHPAPKTVSVNLSTTDIEDGVKRVDVGDGHTTQVTTASRSARQNANAAGGDYYMYFDVDDKFAFAGNRTSVSVDVDYYDLGTGTITLQYDSTGGGAYKTAGSVTLGNKDTWKQATFTLTDAYFGNRQNNGADFRLSAGVGNTFYLDLISVNGAAVIAEPGRAWLPDATGDWQTPTNWSGGAVPNGVDAVATLGASITASRLVYTNSGVTLGTLNFNNANSYQLAGLGTLTMQASGGAAAQVNVAQGTHKLNLPLTIASDTVINVSPGGALLISDPVTVNAGKTLSKIGGGPVTYQSTVTVLAGGSFAISGSAQVGGLALAPNGKVDVAGMLAIGNTNYDAIVARVGDGIMSSSAATDSNHATTLGLIDRGSDVLVEYTYFGDADLSGEVDIADFDQFLVGFGSNGTIWSKGDFDLSGSVDLADFELYVHGFRYQPTPRVTPELLAAVGDFASTQGIRIDLSALPEPPPLALMALAAGGLLQRRRA